MSVTSWKPTQREEKVYSHLFKIALAGSGSHTISGQQSVPFFQKSGLPDTDLGEIWQIADAGSKGSLSFHEFCVAMKLISLVQNNNPISVSMLTKDSPLPKFEGISVLVSLTSEQQPPPASTRRSSAASSIGWVNFNQSPSADNVITPQEKQTYTRIFNNNRPRNGILGTEAVKNILLKSKLTQEQLAQVWNLADYDNKGEFRLPNFYIAMHYVRGLMEGRIKSLPETTPEPIIRSAREVEGTRMASPAPVAWPPTSAPMLARSATTTSAPSASAQRWDIPLPERQKYYGYFDLLDKGKVGYLEGQVPVNFFLASKLPETDLARVWDLADINHTGKLSRDEFAVAMHLINSKLAGKELPASLPSLLVPPSMRAHPAVGAPRSSSTIPQHQSRASPSYGIELQQSRSAALPGSATFSDSDADNSIAELKEQITGLQKAEKDLTTQRESVSSQLNDTLMRKRELTVMLTTLRASYEAEQAINDELEEDLKRERENLSVIQKEIEAERQRMVMLATQKKKLQDDTAAIRGSIAQANAEFRKIQSESARIQTELSVLERQRQLLLQKQQKAQEQVAQEGKDKARLEQEVLDAKEAIERVKADAEGSQLGTASVSVFDEVFSSDLVEASSPEVLALKDIQRSQELSQAQETSISSQHTTTRGLDEPFAAFLRSSVSASGSAKAVSTSSPFTESVKAQPAFTAQPTAAASDPFMEIFSENSVKSPMSTETRRSATQSVSTTQANTDGDFSHVFGDLDEPKSAGQSQINYDFDDVFATTFAPQTTAIVSSTVTTRPISRSTTTASVGDDRRKLSVASGTSVAHDSPKQLPTSKLTTVAPGNTNFKADFSAAFQSASITEVAPYGKATTSATTNIDAFDTKFPEINDLNFESPQEGRKASSAGKPLEGGSRLADKHAFDTAFANMDITSPMTVGAATMLQFDDDHNGNNDAKGNSSAHQPKGSQADLSFDDMFGTGKDIPFDSKSVDKGSKDNGGSGSGGSGSDSESPVGTKALSKSPGQTPSDEPEADDNGTESNNKAEGSGAASSDMVPTVTKD